jgi:C-terminal processing protease CtpA/Prc
MIVVMRSFLPFVARRTVALPFCLGMAALFAPPPLLRADVPATQPSPQTQPAASTESIRQWFDQLADADAEVRDDATDILMQLTRDDLPILRSIVKDELPLAPAQNEALRRIVAQVYLSGEPYEVQTDAGFLGVQTEQVKIASGNGDNGTANNGIMIVNRVAGFCAARMLHNGDVIIGVADSAKMGFDDPLAFRETVMRQRAGSTIHFQVLRRGRVREVAIKLDRRPAVVDLPNDPTLAGFTQNREQLSERYWAENFAPLLKEEVSSTAAPRNGP